MTHREDHRDAEGAPWNPRQGRPKDSQAGVWKRPHGLDLLDVFGDLEGTVNPGGFTSVNHGLLSAVCSILRLTLHPLPPGRVQANPVPAQASCAPSVTSHLPRFSIVRAPCQETGPEQ